MEKLNIAIFEPSRKFIGGGQKVIAKLSSYLSEKNEVTIFTQDPPSKELDFGNSKISLINPKARFLASLAFMFKRVNNFDIVILGGFPANLGSIRNDNCITICYSPTRAFYDLKEYLLKNSKFIGRFKILAKNFFLKKIDYLASQRTRKIFAISKTAKTRIKKFYNRKAEIFYPGIDYNNYKIGRYEDYILCVSRLVVAKRVDVVAKSMQYVKNKKIKLYIVGDGEKRKEIEKIAENNRNIKIFGTVSDKKLKKLYSNCLAVIYIPINEDWGLVPLEAGASGKATIGVKEGGLRETIVDKKTGFLIKKITPESIAKKIDYFINNKSIAIKMGMNAKIFSKKFDWENILKKFEKNLEKTMKRDKK